MNSLRSAKIKKNKGVSLIETVISIPLLLLLILGAIELGRALKVYSSMNVLARGLASSAFRDCSSKALSGNIQSCLDGVLNSTTVSANSILPNSILLVSLYRWDDTRAFPNQPVLVGTSPTTATNPGSKFNVTYFAYANNAERNSMLQDNGIVVYSEIYFPFNSILPLAWFFRLSNNMFYVAAAY